MYPIISIIVPVYNAENYIHQCVKSILAQSFTNYELILVNDGSSDQSSNLCEEYSKQEIRIKVINKINGGVSSARNAGLDVACGEFISFVDVDDWLNPMFYENLYNAINTNKNIDFVLCGYYKVVAGKKLAIETNLPDTYLDRNFIVNNIIGNVVNRNSFYNGIYTACNKLYRRSFIGELHFDENRNHGEDWWFNICIYDRANVIVVVKQCLYYYSISSNQYSLTKKFDDKQFTNLIHTYPKLQEFIKKYNLPEIPANTGRLEDIIDHLVKARISLSRVEFKSYVHSVINNNDALDKIVKLQHNLTGIRAILLQNIKKESYVYWVTTFLSTKIRIINRIKVIKHNIVKAKNIINITE